jgi:hypothetical protein|tara:strand:- start:142 stop:243 length:102 start_codon:yes stop_codon:yes gene_type:complete
MMATGKNEEGGYFHFGGRQKLNIRNLDDYWQEE